MANTDPIEEFIGNYIPLYKEVPDEVTRALLANAPDRLIPRLAKISYLVEGPYARERLQEGVRLRMGDPDETQLLADTWKFISGMPGLSIEKADILVQRALWFPRRLPPAAQDVLLEMLEFFDDELVQVQAVRALLPHLPEDTKDQLEKKFLPIINAPDYFIRLAELDRAGYENLALSPALSEVEVALFKFVEKLDSQQKDRLFDLAVDRITENYHSWRNRPSEALVEAAKDERGGFTGGIGGFEEEPDEASAPPLEPRVVNTGFASPVLPGDGRKPNVPLRPSTDYLFWLEVGKVIERSIEVAPRDLPSDLLPEGAHLQVVLFAFDEELEINSDADVGEIKLSPNGAVVVVRQPIADQARLPTADDLARRLYFPVRSPQKTGEHRMRCNIYFQNVLVQSRLITAKVADFLAPDEGALRSEVDFTMTESLNLREVSNLRSHRFSLIVNDNDDTSHGFRFFGADGKEALKLDASLADDEIQTWIKKARGTLRKASWDSEEDWTNGTAFRYENATTPLHELGVAQRNAALEKLTQDLARIAVHGYRFFKSLSTKLGIEAGGDLERLVRASGSVQIALRMSERQVLPAALVYDYHFDTNKFPIEKTKYQLCPTFTNALVAETNLESCECFSGKCPVQVEGDAIRADPKRNLAQLGPKICPSGLWGYRHSLGLPVTLRKAKVTIPGQDSDSSAAPPADAPILIVFKDRPRVAAGISTDPAFTRFEQHKAELANLSIPLSGPYDTRQSVLSMLKSPDAELIYLYCHGGVSGATPFLKVGPLSESPITPDNIETLWKDQTPFVFINGCHTTSLSPETALNFVQTFVAARGSGVIGTEITISESLACAFAEQCLGRFLGAGDPAQAGLSVGDSVRGARLALLQMGNPLGLAYIPFAVANVRLKSAEDVRIINPRPARPLSGSMALVVGALLLAEQLRKDEEAKNE